jgi:intracellular septation protein A
MASRWIAFGLSHFFYLQLTTPLIWLPAPVFWAYLTGVIYTATGLAIVSGLAIRLAAMTVALQITLITVLVWTPVVAAGNMTAFHWQETIVSWGLTAAAWVLAAGVADGPWSIVAAARRSPSLA